MRNAWRACLGALFVMAVVLAAGPAAAQGTATAVANSGDTAWLLISAALVLLMTAPGLALFYGGLVGQKHVLSTLMHSFCLVCIISVQWVLLGYSLSLIHI